MAHYKVPEYFTFSNGRKIPSIGLGTWQSPKGEVAKAVEVYLKAGGRHVDCAWAYGNEAEVGEGIKNSGVPREELFITSKLFELHHRVEHVELAIRDTLKNLGLDYLDLYLMHWNIAWQVDVPNDVLPQNKDVKKNKEGVTLLDVDLSDDVMPTWYAMEKLLDKGLTKSIGVSNFNINRLSKLLEQCNVRPVANQVELSLQCTQNELVAWCQKQNIQLEGYSPLGGTAGSELRQHPDLETFAKKHDVAVPNIILSWLVRRGIVPLPKSVTPERIKANLKLVALTDEEFNAIEEIAAKVPHNRVCDQSDDFDPFYDIFQEKDPLLSDKTKYQEMVA